MLLALTAAPLAAHAETPASPAPAFAAFEASPLATSPVSWDATVTNVRTDGMGPLASRGLGLRVVADPHAGIRLEVFRNATGEVQSSIDLTGRIDAVAAVTQINDDDNDQRLVAFVRGTLGGAPRLLRIAGTASDSLAGATVAEPTSSAIDVQRLVLLDAASSGLLAVQRAGDGTYTAQRVSYALQPVRDAVTLPLAAADARAFAMAPDSGDLFSIRAGAVDVVSIYDPGTVRSAELPGLGMPERVSVDGSLVALADRDGDVALVGTGADGAPDVRLSLSLGAAPRALDVKDAFEELQVVTADGHSIRRFSTSGGSERPARTFDALTIVDGSLASGRWYEYDSSFLAVAGSSTYRYTDAYLLAPVPVAAILSSPERVGDPVDWSVSAYGTGSVEAVWEYSLDGGAHWAARGAEWSAAAADAGTTIAERPALPQPMDGRAPYYRSEDAGVPLPWVNYGSTEYAVSIPASGYGAQWRPRFTSALGSVVGQVQTIALAVAPGGDTAPVITRHPASRHAVEGTVATFRASATGDPAPTVAWERSTDGSVWTPVSGATATTLSVRASLTDDGSRYRAVFTSNGHTAASESAILTVAAAPAPVVGAAPGGAVTLADATLSFDLNEYGHDWLREAAGANVAIADRGFDLVGGDGWRDPATGAFQIVWQGTATYKPYGGLNGLHLTFANPYLAIDGSGRGTLTAEVSWNNGGGMGGAHGGRESDGSRRVVVDTFTGAAPTEQPDGTFRFASTPEWAGRPYVKPGLADARTYPQSYPASFVDYLDDDLRAWFLPTGNSRDPEKAPREVTAGFGVTTTAAPRSGLAVSATDPLGDGAQHFADAAPVITSQPVAVAVTVGSDATLTVTTSGLPVPAVQWQRSDGAGWTDIPGATASVLRIEGVLAGTQTVRAVASNRVGSVVSDAVAVTGRAPEPQPSTGTGEDPAGGAPTGTPAAPVTEGELLSGMPKGEVTVAIAGRTLVVSHLAPESWFHVYAYSSPTALGWHRSSAAGSFTLTVPQQLADGQHRLAVQDATGAFVGWAGFEVGDAAQPSAVSVVTGRQLAATGGADASAPLAWAALLLVAGAGLVIARRARTSRRAGEAYPHRAG